LGIAARPSAVSRRPSQPGLVERSAYLPDETVGECVPRAIRDLEDGLDMRLREIVGHRDQPVLLDRGLLSPIELLVADGGEQAAFTALVEYAGCGFEPVALQIND
jgi:hypothetical protein